MFGNTAKTSVAVMAAIGLLIPLHSLEADEVWNMATAWGGGVILEDDAKG